ncbi:MAG: glutamine synthetase [Legionellales bacterium]|nr:MAG: glutamine synthetase [Legionellales bacterium]
MISMVEYIWLDGSLPVTQIRSKTRVINLDNKPTIADLPEWSFDGSSTNQATGSDSDCILKPVSLVVDPLPDGGDYVVLCEVYNPDDTPHTTNSRAKLRAALDASANDTDAWFGFEQEYTMFQDNIPLGWPTHGYPAPQGPYYCGVGSEQIFGRELAMEHAHACIDAGLIYYGLNAEVMPGQWEFQIGYRGTDAEDAGALNITDHTWIARWLLHRLGESHDIHISLANKPVKGDWNGAGMHTNFSTKAMRDPKTGKQAIDVALEKLKHKHDEHIASYGDKLEERLTGQHETSSINEFSAGQAHRGCSIRVPRMVADKGYGYLEDRRPGANADPYVVAAKLIATICNI